MEHWNQQEFVDYLINDYCLHHKKYHHYQDNDNEVDMNYESGILDYIFDLIKTITGGTPTSVADMIDDKLEGVFSFDPNMDPSYLKAYVGKSFFAAQDIGYCSYSDLLSTYDEDDSAEILSNVMSVEHRDNTDYCYIPKGTKMTLISEGQKDGSGWPIFEIHGYEFDFAGAPFKLKPVKED